ncbi:Crp/Fnr family transcriptional regulator [Dinghuibacter silviterrae]|uniref:CRP/FNR family transcriptional regulator n=1 Tax=Dinghuibacter silviterrae TaxID=1539049 RepID=A0A4R8DSZ4_9BACT|nr:Crp/Fnr family transcriptional regulator [Dinghuibacter silviterrae]TDX01209.1 CRP/FNR family transcriptional regulator [Dinghuibacter silviterrae]
MFCDLSSCFLCTHCIPEWKEVIALRKQTLSFKKGQPVFSEGEPVEGIFFVYSGSVKVHQQWGADKELILRFARAGDVLGYRGQAAGVHPVTATPLEATQVCHIPQSLLEATFKANPSFLYQMMQLYAGELQEAERRMRHLALTEVRGRIADALLTIRGTFGEGPEGFVSIPITRQDIASYAGTSYETVFKLFTEWTGQGILDTSGKYIRILDDTKLQALIPQ